MFYVLREPSYSWQTKQARNENIVSITRKMTFSLELDGEEDSSVHKSHQEETTFRFARHFQSKS